MAYNEKVTPLALTKDGYALTWLFGTDVYDFEINTVTEDITLTANWTLIEYAITYTMNDGHFEDGVVYPVTYNIKSETIVLVAPVKEGYAFKGWLNDANGQVVTEIATGSTGDLALTASWEEIVETPEEPAYEEYTVNYVFGDQEYADGTALTEVNVNGDLTFVAGKGTNTSNAPKYYVSDFTLRFYKLNTLTISCQSNQIKSIVITTVTTAKYTITSSNLTLTNGTAEFNGATVTITPNGEGAVVLTRQDVSDSWKILSIQVTYLAKALSDNEKAEKDINALPELNKSYATDFEVETTGKMYGNAIEWSTDNEAISISGNKATVKRAKSEETVVTLTAKITVGGQVISRTFTVKVLSDQALVDADLQTIQDFNFTSATRKVDIKGVNGSTITWKSSNDAVISIDNTTGEVTVTPPTDADAEVTVTATLKLGEVELTQDFTIEVSKASVEKKEVTETLSFASTAQRVSQTSEQQVWANGIITLTNDKDASTNAVANYSNPARFYAKSIVKIDCTGITKIEFTANTTTYAGALQTSLNNMGLTDATVSINSKVVTIEFATPVDSIEFTCSAQIRLNSLTVTAMQ